MVHEVWSCGGGTQSAAIAALIVRGDLPVPDLAVIVDTEREKSSTWLYMTNVIDPAVAKLGVVVHRIKKSEFATVDVYSDSGRLLLPVFAGDAKLPGYCSNEWKRRVIMRWLRSQGVEQARNWLGLSTDEMKRVRAQAEKWFEPRYPLIELGMSRERCRWLVESMGWPTPPKSACYMCPNHPNEGWRDMKKNYPADFIAAVVFEREMQVKDPHFFIHRSLTPLDQVDFEDHQNQLFDNDKGCDSGYCFS